jgi:hypothetical protein
MVGASGRATACAASVGAVEPTPIFAALAAPAARDTAHGGRGSQGGRRRTVPELLVALRDEDRAVPAVRGRVGHVPGLLTFRPRA